MRPCGSFDPTTDERAIRAARRIRIPESTPPEDKAILRNPVYHCAYRQRERNRRAGAEIDPMTQPQRKNARKYYQAYQRMRHLARQLERKKKKATAPPPTKWLHPLFHRKS